MCLKLEELLFPADSSLHLHKSHKTASHSTTSLYRTSLHPTGIIFFGDVREENYNSAWHSCHIAVFQGVFHELAYNTDFNLSFVSTNQPLCSQKREKKYSYGLDALFYYLKQIKSEQDSPHKLAAAESSREYTLRKQED